MEKITVVLDADGLTAEGLVCTIGPSAVTGERCGKRAVVAFTARDGHAIYAECAEHAMKGA